MISMRKRDYLIWFVMTVVPILVLLIGPDVVGR